MLSRLTAAIGLAFIVGTTVWLTSRSPTVGCGPPAARGSNMHHIAASKVVVRPWFGRHHVYGIFAVPDRFIQRRYSAILAVDDFEAPIIRNLIPQKAYIDASLARSGHYLERAYVPTRVALWFLFTGRFGNLRTPCHWHLAFDARTI